MISKYMRICFSPDEDGGAPSTGDSATTTTTTPGTETAPTATPEAQPTLEPTYERPKYFAQVNPTKADSEDYKALYRYQKIDELADAYLAQSKEMADLRKKSENSIYVPQSDDAEGIKTFKAKLGVPETADGYTLKSLSDAKLGISDEAKKVIRETAYKGMLSDRQADAIGVSLLKVAELSLKNQKAQRENAVKNFDTTLTASYSDITSETDRKSAAERDKASYERFATESGIKDWLDDRGLSSDPTFVKAVAQYARKHSGTAPQSNLPNTRPNGARSGADTPISERAASFYGKAFNDAYGKH